MAIEGQLSSVRYIYGNNGMRDARVMALARRGKRQVGRAAGQCKSRSLEGVTGHVRVDRVLGDVAFDTDVVVALAVALEWSAEFAHLGRCAPRPRDDLTDSAHRLGVRAVKTQDEVSLASSLCVGGL